MDLPADRAAGDCEARRDVTPLSAGVYFNKLYCFCFDEQTLQPGESVEMPIVFFVDPALLEKEELQNAPTITLSYTFFPAGNSAPVAAAEPAGGASSGSL